MEAKKILFFTARYCGKCFAIKKRVQRLVDENLLTIDYQIIDVEVELSITKKYKVVGVPTTIVLENGRVVKTVKGSLYREDIIDLAK